MTAKIKEPSSIFASSVYRQISLALVIYSLIFFIAKDSFAEAWKKFSLDIKPEYMPEEYDESDSADAAG